MSGRPELVVFVIILFYSDIYSQPTTKDEFNIIRQSRQLNFETCCPCPDNTNEYTDLRYPATMTSMPRYNEEIQIKNDNGFSNEESMGNTLRSKNLDDCPYPSRSADSEGSSSIFFPTSLRANGLSRRPLNQKEDQKNLLEPEVGLASSVLETIREATEVEYQDALAREAEKTRAVNDVVANESAPNVVTIILPSHKRENDNSLISEATNVHDSRCIHPLGSSLSNIKPLKTIPENLLEIISRIPTAKPGGLLHKNLLDMDNNVQASNVQDNFLQKNDPNFELKTNSEFVGDNEENTCLTDSKTESKTVPSILLHEQSNSSNKEKSVGLGNNLQAQPSTFKSLSLLHNKDLFKVKNLLKLRDSELISPTKKLNIPLLRLPSFFHRELPHLTDILRNENYLKHTNEWSSVKNCDKSPDDNGLDMKANILEKQPSLSFNEMKNKNKTPENLNLHQLLNKLIIPTSKLVKTEIIDSVSSPSENIAKKNFNNYNENNNIGLAKDSVKENENVCTNIDEANEEINNNSSEELNQIPSDLISAATADDHNISVTNDEDEPNNPLNIDNENNDGSTVNDCIEYIDDDREKIGSGIQVFENDDNPDLVFKSLHTDEPFDLGDGKKTALFDNVSFNGMTKLVNENVLSPMNKTLTSIKEDIKNKIQEFGKIPTLATQKTLKATTENNKQNELNSAIEENVSATDCQNAASMKLIERQNSSNEDGKKALDNISMEDLQKMSDSLLKMNEMKQKFVKHENSETNQLENADSKNVENVSLEADSEESFNSHLSSPALKKMRNRKVVNNEEVIIVNKNPVDKNTKTSINSDQPEDDCLIETPSKHRLASSRNVDKNNNQSGHLSKGVGPDEMRAEASDPIINELYKGPLNIFNKLKSPLLQDIIVQPSSFIRDDLNPLSDGSGLDFSGLLNIPKLDEIRERLADLFGTSERESDREAIDCENNSPIMSSEPSEPIFRSIPLLKPLEDVDIDIFQLKPFTIGESNLLSEAPRLNLKSYKAKLPIPKNLQLKPMKLESTLGNRGGVLGATFRIGPESEIKNTLSNLLGKPSRIEDVTSQLKNNVETLLKDPLNTLQDFRSSPITNTFTKDLKSQTLNTIKGIQENIGNSFKIAKNDDLRSSFVKQPDDFLERIAEARDNLNDKLKGLHHDLNDRLLSMQEDILDRTKLISVSNSLFDERKAKESLRSPLQRKNLSKTPMERLSTKKINNSPKLHNKPEFEKVPLLRSSKINDNDKIKLKSYKMPSSASVSVPKNVPVPYLKQASTKSTLSYLQRNPNVKHVTHGMIREGTENHPVVSDPSRFKNLSNEQNTNKPKTSLKDTSFKVAMGSTTLSPLSELKSRKATNPVLQTQKNNILKQPEFRLGKNLSKNKQDYDTVESLPKMKTVTSQFSYRRKLDSTENKDIMMMKDDVEKPIGSTTIKPIREWFKQRYSSKKLTSNIFDKKGTTTKPPPSLHLLKSGTVSQASNKEVNFWPDITEKSFLSKVRDAVKARVSSQDLEKTIKDNDKSEIIPDTERAASETTDVGLSESLKENVSYKCRMICTKET